MRKLKFTKYCVCLIAAVVIVLLQGCAAGAAADKMVISNQVVAQGKQTTLKDNVTVAKVTGGKPTHPLWASNIDNKDFKAALETSLKKVNLYKPEDGAKYKLTADLVELDQPFIGFDMEVKCNVHYILINNSLGKKVYDKNIKTVYTATMDDAYYGVERLKIANEGAARKNIEQLINDLYKLFKI